MKPIIKQKETDALNLANEIKDSSSFLMFEFKTLDAKKTTALRKKLHEANAKIYVARNNIFNRAFKLANVSGIEEATGPNAVIVSKGEQTIPFKEINDIIKENKNIKFKFGMIEGSIIKPENLASIANIPGREGLYSMLLSCLQAPIRNFLYGLKAVSEAKPA